MRQFSRSFIAFWLILSSLAGSSLPLLAQISSLGFIPPDDHIGEPRNVGGGGSRGGLCEGDPQNQQPLTILVPPLPESSQNTERETETKRVLRGGLTTHSFPLLFVYLPATHAKTGEFILFKHLEDGQSKEIYYDTFSLPDESGIIHLLMPIALEVGPTYEWSLTLICNTTESTSNAVVNSTIERVFPSTDLAIQRENASLTTKIQLYGQAGFWYDFLALLTLAIARSPQLQRMWQTVVRRNIGLDYSIARSPFLTCCSLTAEPISGGEQSE